MAAGTLMRSGRHSVHWDGDRGWESAPFRHLYLYLPAETLTDPDSWEKALRQEFALRGLRWPVTLLSSLLVTGPGAQGLGRALVPTVCRILGWSLEAPRPVQDWALEVDPEVLSEPSVLLHQWWEQGVHRVVFRPLEPGTAHEWIANESVLPGRFSATLPLGAGDPPQSVQDALALKAAGAVALALDEGESESDSSLDPKTPEATAETLVAVAKALVQEGWVRADVAFFHPPGVRLPYPRALRRREPVLGVGPGAITFRQPHRRWNPDAPSSYLSRVGEGRDPVEGWERLNRAETRLERIWHGLRTSRGLVCSAGGSYGPQTQACLARWAALGYLVPNPKRIVLTLAGQLQADRLAVALSIALDEDALDLRRRIHRL